MREDLIEQFDEQSRAFTKALSPFFSEKQIHFILDVWTLDVENNNSLDIEGFIQNVERLYPFSVEDQQLRNAIDNELMCDSPNHHLLQGADLSKQFSQIMAFIFYAVPNSQLPAFFDAVKQSVTGIDGMGQDVQEKIADKLAALSKQVALYNTQEILDLDMEVFINEDAE